jgi:uncharacterized repeat protein (TIGR01451 family)
MSKPQPAPLLGLRRAAGVARTECAKPGRPRFGRAARLGVLALAALAAAGAGAQHGEGSERGLDVLTLVEKLAAGPDGASSAPVLLPPTAAPDPGDALVYTVQFKNSSAGAVDDVRITKPVPPGVRYVAGSASGPGCEVLFSVDGGRTFGLANELSVAAVDGTRRAAEPDDYTHIRWRLRTPLAPDATGFVRFRAVAR